MVIKISHAGIVVSVMRSKVAALRWSLLTLQHVFTIHF